MTIYQTQANVSLNLTAAHSTIQEDCDPLLDSAPVKLVKTLTYSLVLVVALVGNSLVIAATWRNRQLRTIINFFILNMAVSDLVVPLIDIPIQITNIYSAQGSWFAGGVFGSVTCKISEFLIVESATVSILTLEIIAIERFFSIIFPMKTQPINSKKTCFVLIAFIWFVGAFYPSIFLYKARITYKGTTPLCTVSWEPALNNKEAAKIEFPISLVCFTLVPFILLTSLYSAIIVSLHRQKASRHLDMEERRRRAKENRQVTYMLGAVVAVFLVSWTPFHVYRLLIAYVWSSGRPCELTPVIFSGYFLTCIYPALNPLIYYIFNHKYRKGFQQIWRLLFRCNNHVFPNNISLVVSHKSSNKVVLLSMRAFDA